MILKMCLIVMKQISLLNKMNFILIFCYFFLKKNLNSRIILDLYQEQKNPKIE